MKEVQSNPSKWKLYSVATAFTLSIGFSFYGIKKCVPYADSLEILAYRYMAAVVGVLLWLAVMKAMGKAPEKIPGRPKKKLYQTAAFYILFMILQIIAMFFASSIEGALVYAVTPIFAKIIGRIFLGERSTRLQNIFMAITVAALVILIILNATDIKLNTTGLILMVISSIFMGCNNVSARYVRGVFKPIEITKCIALGGFPIFVGAALIRDAVRGDIMDFFEPLKHAEFVIWISFLGIFCILLSAQFMAYMLAHMQIVQSTIFSSASTFVSVIAGALLLGEPLYWYHYVCGILIIIGVAGIALAPVDESNSGKSLGDDMK